MKTSCLNVSAQLPLLPGGLVLWRLVRKSVCAGVMLLRLVLSATADDVPDDIAPARVDPRLCAEEPRRRTAAEASARVSIPGLLRPETRLRAFQKFRLQSEPLDAKWSCWDEPENFLRWHSDLEVARIGRGRNSPRYLVTWFDPLQEFWSKEAPAAESPESAGKVLRPRPDTLYYQIFSADGTRLLNDDGHVRFGNIADFKGEGKPEFIERVQSSSGSSGHFEFLQVRPPGRASKASFAVLYNTHPTDRAPGNTWGFQLRDADGDGVYEIELGPVIAPEGVEPQVRFRWDKARRVWTGPEQKKGDHFRVIKSARPFAEASRIARNGGLGYALAASPWSLPAAKEIPTRYDDRDKLPVELLSHAYHAESLKELTDAELFAFMASGPDSTEFIYNQMRKATSVPDFWTLDPQAAALAYVRQNRPPTIAAHHLLSFAAGAEAAPTEGDLTLVDGPASCFGPTGAYIHHLHCANEGSYLVYSEAIDFRLGMPLTESRSRFEFRQLALDSGRARQILQTVWWMARIRSRQLTRGPERQWISGFSTGDGPASVQLVSPAGTLTVRGFRSYPFGDKYMALGAEDESYDPLAFINLVVQLFFREVQDGLGEPWKSQEIPLRWSGGMPPLPAQHSPAELARVKAASAKLLRLYREGSLSAPAALAAAHAAGEMGWQDLRADVEVISKRLPPPVAYEKHLMQLDAEFQRWKKELGTEADDAAHVKRGMRRSARQKGNAYASAADRANPLTPTEEAKFGAFDALYENRERLRRGTPGSLQQTITLRDNIGFSLRQLELFEDVEGLSQWALDDDRAVNFALTRLVQLNPKRAIDLLSHFEAAYEASSSINPYTAPRRTLEAGGPEALRRAQNSPLAAGGRAAALDPIAGAHVPESARAELHESLAAELQVTNGRLNDSLLRIWQLDFRDLKPQLERIATAGPQDYEGSQAKEYSDKGPLTQRNHRARQIAALWNEEDLLTRAKLLVAFAAAHPGEFADEATGTPVHLRSELALVRSGLTPQQHGRLEEFIHWCEASKSATEHNQSVDTAIITAVFQSIRGS